MPSSSPRPSRPRPPRPPPEATSPLLAATLKRKLEGASRLAILAVGSSLRGDDAAGLIAAERLRQLLQVNGESPCSDGDLGNGECIPASSEGDSTHFRLAGARGPVDVAIFIGETAPENLTGEIRRFKPTHVMILDAADFGIPPGQIDVIDPDQAVDNSSGSTHSLPMHVLRAYLRHDLDCRFLIVGIQPECVKFGHAVAPAVSAAADTLAKMIMETISQ